MLWLVLVVIVLGLGYYFLRRPFDYWPQKGVRQLDPVIIFGNFWPVISKKLSIFHYVQQSYSNSSKSRYVGVYQFFSPVLQINDPDLVKQITVKDFDHFTDHMQIFPDGGSALWSRNLITLKGKEWREMRSLLTPSFTGSKMKVMFGLMQDVAENWAGYFKDMKKDSVEVEMKNVFTRYTNDVIASTAFGIQVDSMRERENEFYVMGKEATNLKGVVKAMKFFLNFVFPKVIRFFKISFFDEKLNNYFIDLIKSNIRAREEQNIIRPDMIHLLMEARKGNQKLDEIDDSELLLTKPPNFKEITDIDIAAQGMVFFFAGFDSVSTLMSFMAYELAVNPEIQTKMREEIRATVKKCPGGKLTYEAVSGMKYLEMVISEALRKWPNAVATDRICTKPYTIKAEQGETDLDLPLGTIISIPIIGFHYDEKYFPEPERFDPERFSDENKANVKPGTFMPFGIGPRGCIGNRFAMLETKIVFAHLLMDFEIVPSGKSTIPLRISKNHLALAAEGGLWFNFKRL